MNQIVAEKIQSIEDRKLNRADVSAELDSKPDSLIDRLMEFSLNNGTVSLDDVASEANTILIAVSISEISSNLIKQFLQIF